jgi:membrane protein implicated in regulation of membrane protease activity
MDDWVWWMIAAGVLAVGEIATLGFFLGPIAVAATLTAIVALAGGGLAVQWVVFIAASLGSVLVLRPVARRHLRTPASLRTGTAALVGGRAVVLERVDANGGQVKIGGETWSARAYDEDDSFEPGARVEVMQIDGATALVAE